MTIPRLFPFYRERKKKKKRGKKKEGRKKKERNEKKRKEKKEKDQALPFKRKKKEFWQSTRHAFSMLRIS